jgi:hypothetical protein
LQKERFQRVAIGEFGQRTIEFDCEDNNVAELKSEEIMVFSMYRFVLLQEEEI